MQAELVRYGPGEVWPDHEHSRLSISIVLGGSVIERTGHTEVEAVLGSAVVKPPRSVHSNRFGRAGAVFLAVWPDAVLAEDLVRNRASELRWRHDRKQLRRWIAVAQELSVGDPWGMAEEEVLALTDAEDVPVLGRALACARVEEIRDRIHAMQPGRPSVAELARSVGVHPVYLTRSFRRRYGCSIAGYVRRIRVEQIAALLISRECPPLAAVAHELGFADQSHLCRTFAAELGVSPGNYRRTICVGASGSQ